MYTISKNHIKQTTYFIYFTALLAGFAFPLSGIISPQIAKHFGLPTNKVVLIDSLVLIGLIVGNAWSGQVIKIIGGRRTLILSFFILFLDQLGIATQNLIVLYTSLVFLFGAAMGILITTVSYIINMTFSHLGQGTSKLNIMNFFVSIGAFIGSIICGSLAYYFTWRSVYFITAAIFLIILVFAFNSKVLGSNDLFENNIKISEKKGKKISAITYKVILVGLALVAYVYAEYVITYWFSPYLQLSLHYNVKTVGFILGAFWLSLAFGRYIFAVTLIPKLGDSSFIIIVTMVTICGFLIFISIDSITLILLTTILLGLSCSSIFPTLLGYGMKQTKANSPVTMAFLITSGSVGGFISLIISSTIGTYLSKIFAIYMGPICCIVIIICICLVKMQGKPNSYKSLNVSN